MQNILLKIASVDEKQLLYAPFVGSCACCNMQVTKLEIELVDEFWLHLTQDPDPHFFIDLIFNCEELTPDQFNDYHEPILCLNCLKNAIHEE